jgi:hypothetical protein
MCDMTEIRIVAEDGQHGHLTWFWPTTMLDKLLPTLHGVAVRDSVGALYFNFEEPGTLVFDRTSVRFEIVARTVSDPPGPTPPSRGKVGTVPVPHR